MALSLMEMLAAAVVEVKTLVADRTLAFAEPLQRGSIEKALADHSIPRDGVGAFVFLAPPGELKQPSAVLYTGNANIIVVLATASTTAANNLLLTAWEALIKRFFKINGGGIVSCTGAPTFDLIGETNEIMVAFTDFQAKYKITTEMKK